MDHQPPTSRVVLLTGGASGIGAALPDALLARGDDVVVLDRHVVTSTTTARGSLHSVVGDVTDPEANEAAVALALAEFGRVDSFVGNAGVHDGGLTITGGSPTAIRDTARLVLDVNVVGYLVGAAAAAEAVTASRGTMVFTLSDASFVVAGNGAGVAYAASKHAALGVVRSLAAQLAPAVRVNAVAPGGVLTALRTAGSGDQPGRSVFTDPAAAVDQIAAMNPLGVVLRAEELVPHYLFLLDEHSRGLTGHVLRPDGGLSVA